MAEIFIIADMGGLQHFQMGVIFAGAIPFNNFMPDGINKGVEILDLHGGNPVHINLNVRKKLDKVLMGGKFAEQTPHVRPVSFSFGKQNSSEPSFQQLEIVPLSSPTLLAYLQGRGINIELAKRECSEARFTHNGKRYFAIAFPNGSGGYEIRNRYFKGCIAPKEISHIRQSGKARNTCYVFEGFMDYLSFLTLRQENCPNYPELDGQDYIVLNSVSNVNKALYPLGNYERIHCFFDNDHAGMEALRQIREEYGRDRYIRDASQTYSGCKDLNEHLQKQVERKRQLQSAKGVRSQSPEKKSGFRL